MMLLLALIYLIFISLGLPDSLFGAAWPIMHLDFGVNESFGSIYMIITAVGSGGMSFFAGPLIRKFGTGRVTVVSVALTAVGMLTIGLAPHIALAIFGSILMGLGAGAIDTGLNSYVSTHYKASHMNWLHAFWGVGVTLSPLIMSAFLSNGENWQGGYRCVAYIQCAILAVAAVALPLWKKYDKKTISPSNVDLAEQTSADTVAPKALAKASEQKKSKPAFFTIIKTPGVLFAVLALGFYTAMEFLIGTWGASYAVNVKAVSAALAARWVSLYYGGIMIGRVLSGFLSYKLNDKQLIRIGVCVMMVGMIVFALPIGEKSLVGLLLIGIGFGPVFPSTIHSVPTRFGEKYAADITGIQMGGSYAVGWAVQLVFGFVAPRTTFAFMPYLMIALAAALLLTTELVNRITARRQAPLSIASGASGQDDGNQIEIGKIDTETSDNPQANADGEQADNALQSANVENERTEDAQKQD